MEQSWNLWIAFHRPATQSPIASAKQLFLAAQNYAIDSQNADQSLAPGFPRSINDLIKHNYLSLSDINYLFPHGLIVYTPQNENENQPSPLITGYFQNGQFTLMSDGDLQTSYYAEKKN